MLPATLALSLPFSTTAWSMSAAGLGLLVFGLVPAKNDVAQARGIEKIVALTNLCFAIPLAVFGAEHLANPQGLLPTVPSYMPFRMFWVWFVGCALIAAALSIAAKRLVQWSGFLVGLMMYLFVAMLHLPGALANGGRIPWTIVFREISFGSAGWILAGIALGGNSDRTGKTLITLGRVLIGIAAIFFGVQHFLHPLGLPGVPLLKEMPTWVPARPVVDYLTGAALVVAGVGFVLDRKARMVATYLGAWIVFLVVVIYGPVLIGALANPSAGVQVEGLNYFADTLLYGAVILAVARSLTAFPARSPKR